MSKRYLYKHGLPFSEKLAENLDAQINRVFVQNKASLIIIDGGVGEGKTTLASEIADYIQGEPIVFSEFIGLGGKDFINKLKKGYEKKHKVVIYDEGGDFDKRGAMSRFNALLNRVFDTYRAFKIIVIVCLPSFYVLDNSIFDKCIPRLLIHLQGRSNKYGRFKGYGLNRMNWVRFYMNKYKYSRSYAYEKTSCNFWGQFLDLPPERSEELDSYTIKGKFDILDEASHTFENLIDYKEIAHKVNRSYLWVAKTVNKLKIKPDKVYKKKKYFHKSIVERLVDTIDTGGKK